MLRRRSKDIFTAGVWASTVGCTLMLVLFVLNMLAPPTNTEAGYSYVSKGYMTLRDVTATEDTLLVAGTQQTAPSEADDGTVAFLKPIGAVHITFIGTAAADKTMSWWLWGYKSASDPGEYIAHGTATTGATTCSHTTNGYYADTIVITDQQWLTPVSVIVGCPDSVISGGGIAKLCLDTNEYQFIKVQIRDVAGGGAEAATAGADIATIHR